MAVNAFESKGRPVYNKDGELVGRIGEDPKVEEPTALELINKGFKDKELAIEAAMLPVVEKMTVHAKAVRRLYDTTSQWNIHARIEAIKKAAELKQKFEDGKKELAELRNSLTFGRDNEHSKTVDEFVKNLERHFTEEPFILGRF